jgi:hypothetical protein
VFVSVKDDDKPALVDITRRLLRLGFTLVATGGTHGYLERKQIKAERVNKVTQGKPHIVDAIRSGTIALVINTTAGKQEISDSFSIRRESLTRASPTSPPWRPRAWALARSRRRSGPSGSIAQYRTGSRTERGREGA